MAGFDITLRVATAADAAELRLIYAPYVEQTAVSFEYDVPTVAEFAARIERTLQCYPYLVAERSGEIIGYAYLSAFVERAAYDHTAETSIYLRTDQRRRGVGSLLYTELERVASAQGIVSLYACIGCPAALPDAYLTDDSVRFHAGMGYRQVGEFRQCGYKFGRWYNMIWMEKQLGVHPNVPAPFIPFAELPLDVIAASIFLADVVEYELKE